MDAESYVSVRTRGYMYVTKISHSYQWKFPLHRNIASSLFHFLINRFSAGTNGKQNDDNNHKKQKEHTEGFNN